MAHSLDRLLFFRDFLCILVISMDFSIFARQRRGYQQGGLLSGLAKPGSKAQGKRPKRLATNG